MDVNLRKTATDTAYVVVGVGVLGFQQAQVKRRDAVARVTSLGQDARSTLASRTDTIKSRTEGCAANLGSLGSTISEAVGSTVSSTLDAVGTQVKSGASAARNADPRVWAEPVVGDIRVRVEPVIEQLRTITLPGTVSAIPDQLSKTIEVGRNRVQGLRGTTPTTFPTAANGNA
jgi:hypothetical protein